MFILTRNRATFTAGVLTATVLATWGVLGLSGSVLAHHRPGHQGGGGGDGDADTTPPDAVVDLVAQSAALGALSLTWTAVGDDAGGVDCSGAGKASVYDVRYSTSPIQSDADFDAATPAVGEPEPGSCGATETFCLGALDPGLVYDVALRVEDEAGNVSGLSNVAVAAAGDMLGFIMHVAYLDASWALAGGPKRRPRAFVRIEDELGLPVEGATVTGDFSGCTSDPGFSAVTDCSGLAIVEGQHVAQCQRGGNLDCCFVFIVTNVTHDLVTYDPYGDVAGCDWIPCNFHASPFCGGIDPCQ